MDNIAVLQESIMELYARIDALRSIRTSMPKGKAYAHARDNALKLKVSDAAKRKLQEAKSRAAVIVAVEGEIAMLVEVADKYAARIEQLLCDTGVEPDYEDMRVATNFTFSPLSKWVVVITVGAAVGYALSQWVL